MDEKLDSLGVRRYVRFVLRVVPFVRLRYANCIWKHSRVVSQLDAEEQRRLAAGFFAHAAARDPPVSLENTVDLDDSIGHTTRVDGTASFGSVTPADEMQVNPQHCTDCNEFQRMPSSILQAARAHFSL